VGTVGNQGGGACVDTLHIKREGLASALGGDVPRGCDGAELIGHQATDHFKGGGRVVQPNTNLADKVVVTCSTVRGVRGPRSPSGDLERFSIVEEHEEVVVRLAAYDQVGAISPEAHVPSKGPLAVEGQGAD